MKTTSREVWMQWEKGHCKEIFSDVQHSREKHTEQIERIICFVLKMVGEQNRGIQKYEDDYS